VLRGHTLGARHGLPRLKSLPSGGVIISGGQPVMARSEEVVDRTNREPPGNDSQQRARHLYWEEDQSYEHIADQLNQAELFSPTGKRWTTASIRKLLEAASMMGRRLSGHSVCCGRRRQSKKEIAHQRKELIFLSILQSSTVGAVH
jgi:hypothetical protein